MSAVFSPRSSRGRVREQESRRRIQERTRVRDREQWLQEIRENEPETDIRPEHNYENRGQAIEDDAYHFRPSRAEVEQEHERESEREYEYEVDRLLADQERDHGQEQRHEQEQDAERGIDR